MAYYLDICSPTTYEESKASDQTITGFRMRQLHAAQKVRPGDKFITYMTKLSRWVGVSEVLSDCFIDETSESKEEEDPYIVQFKIRPLVWLDKELAVPIREDRVWNTLSITKNYSKTGSRWTSAFRSSLYHFSDEDGVFLEKLLLSQMQDGIRYPVDETEYAKYLTHRVRREDKVVAVSVPEDVEAGAETHSATDTIRESHRIQANLAKIGERMGFSIWLPKNDRGSVLQEWTPPAGVLLDKLPLNYDTVTLRTIEQIDVIWLKKRAIVRAFEVEHTTSIYSGILRMADLLALQPNMDIQLHIVAPYNRREKVFQELQRPVFSLLERAPLSELCTYVSYESVYELMNQKFLSHLSDSVLEEYAEFVE